MGGFLHRLDVSPAGRLACRVDSPSHWRNQDAASVRQRKLPHRLDVRPLKGHFREDPSTIDVSDSGMLTNGKIPPLTGGIRTLENLADSTDAEYEEDRPEKQFLRKLQWMWE